MRGHELFMKTCVALERGEVDGFYDTGTAQNMKKG